MTVRLWGGFFAIFVVVVLVLDVAAYAYVGRTVSDLMQPVLSLAEGRAAYAAEMRRVAFALALLDVPLVLAVGAAAYGAAALAVRPLLLARAREERFAADVAHELRTPLARIAALAHTAGDRPEDERRTALAAIETLSHEAGRLIGDLLTTVRAERVAPELSEPVDLGHLAARVAGHHERVGVTIDVAVSDAADVYVLGDERRLLRLTENLIENAARHARSRVDVRISCAQARVQLTVDDDGDGVPANLRAKVFERFVRARDDGAGTGLGLAIAREIARAHGGELTLEDGARFVATFPRAGT